MLLTVHLRCTYNASPTTYHCWYIRNFGSMLRVPYIIGAKSLDW